MTHIAADLTFETIIDEAEGVLLGIAFDGTVTVDNREYSPWGNDGALMLDDEGVWGVAGQPFPRGRKFIEPLPDDQAWREFYEVTPYPRSRPPKQHIGVVIALACRAALLAWLADNPLS